MKKQNIVCLCIVSFILLTFCLVSVNIVSASIESIGSVKQNDCITLPQICNCTFNNITTIMYPNKSYVTINKAMTKDGTYFNYTFCNTTDLGQYFVNGVGDKDGTVTPFNYYFDVTTTGNNASLTSIIFYVAGLGVLLFFLVACVISFVKVDNPLNRVGMGGASYLILIGLSFISYQMCLDFLTRDSFITHFVWIVWIVLMYASILVFPIMFIWYFYTLGQIKEIKQLMDKGFTGEEAEHRVKNRRRR